MERSAMLGLERILVILLEVCRLLLMLFARSSPLALMSRCGNC